MNKDAKIAEQFAELPEPTRKFLSELTVEDATALEAGMPLVRALIGFAKVSKWIIITILGILGGVVLLGESVFKILAWFKPPPP
ncbi:hypothetical protein [Mesorhizobium marinum]|uniref:Uncharacterized protein n=1 Tax=Mesorhizobium marinum TaxID=3228790 RepID=A0ABV3R5K7_9HYPH